MKTSLKIVIMAALMMAVIGAVAMKKDKHHCASNNIAPPVSVSSIAAETGVSKPSATNETKLPKLIDLGAGKCIPCKMMAPILDDLKKDYEGRMNVEFIDVWQNPDAGKKYGIDLIPTQIFYDATGKEVFRHSGFFAKEDILANWKELGVDLTGKNGAADSAKSPSPKLSPTK